MRVYRVERINGRGPYRTGYSNSVHPNGYDKDRHPSPEWHLSAFCGQDSKWLFGFRTLRRLYAWFNPAECAALTELEFGVSYYDVTWTRKYPTVAHASGDEQLIFYRPAAQLFKHVELRR